MSKNGHIQKVTAKRKILIMGLPGSGKSTIAELVSHELGAVWFNADAVREEINKDLDFSVESRNEQARRMGWICDQVTKTGSYAVADFVCPTEEARLLFDADLIVWVNRITEGRFEDTNKMFVPPVRDKRWTSGEDIVLKNGTPQEMCDQVIKHINSLESWNNQAPTALLIGRYQPFHDGHKALVAEAIRRTGQCCIALRDVGGIDDNNPYEFEVVRRNILRACREFGNKINVIDCPNIMDVFYGRGVGYNIERIDLDKEFTDISATKVRKGEIDVHGNKLDNSEEKEPGWRPE
jgi:hypothetical protein